MKNTAINEIPRKEQKRLFVRECKALYRLGYTYDQIAARLHASKTTVHFAIKGRPTPGRETTMAKPAYAAKPAPKKSAPAPKKAAAPAPKKKAAPAKKGK